MRCASLISGSKANAFYIEQGDDALLIDAGLSLPKTEATLAQLELNSHKIRGILVTHEHDDHIRHLRRIAHHYHLPVYMTQESYNKSGLSLRDIHIIKAGDHLNFGALDVDTFEVLHDAEMCLGFVFHAGGKKVFYASDIGSYSDQILAKAENSDFIGIEANYELAMLRTSKYPQYLKDRITSGSGHLSNHEAARFVRDTAGENTKHVMFLHISENTNCVNHVERMIDQDLAHCIPDVSYKISNKHTFTPLITI
ncbi:MAG: MBL fold metallo-hydrolase [Brevinema sp.]